MANNADKRYWTWTFAELEVYFGVRRGGASYYLKGQDFQPEILGLVQPKQLVETQTHPGFIPVKMGEDGKRPITLTVEKMLGGIPHAVMRKAVLALEGKDRDIYRIFMAAQRRSPLDTMDMVAEAQGVGIATLYRRLIKALGFIDWYLEMESAGWPDGAQVS